MSNPLCQYAKLFREVNYEYMYDRKPQLTRDDFDNIVYIKYMDFLRFSNSRINLKKDDLVIKVSEYLNSELDGYDLFMSIIDNKENQFFERMYSYYDY
jgi:hypothetical protein